MANLKTIGKWVVPATVVSMAVAAIVFLGVLELSGPAERGSGSVDVASVEPVVPRAARRARRAPVEAPPPRSAPAAPRVPRQAPRAAAPVAQRRAQPGAAKAESKRAAEAATLLVMLARAEDLGARLRVLDRHLAKLSPERALVELEGLLDSVLPGRFAEAEQLRLGILSRLGRYDDPRAEAALVRRLDAELPRPQRLLALELLAARPHVGRASIGAIAAQDDDAVVRKKAAWALRHTP